MTALGLASAGGLIVLLVIIVAIVLAVAWSYYSRTGTDISQHPTSGEGGPGRQDTPDAAGSGGIAGGDAGSPDSLDTRGTR